MEKYLVIRDYLKENITPTVVERFDDYNAAKKFAKDKNKGKEFVKFWVFKQSK